MAKIYEALKEQGARDSRCGIANCGKIQGISSIQRSNSQWRIYGAFSKAVRKSRISCPICTFANVVTSFEKYGVNLFFDENTSEAKLAQIVRKFNSCRKMDLIRQDFIESNQDIIKGFMDSLEASLRRRIKSILILPLHGKGVTFTNLRHAIKYIKSYNNIPVDAPLDRFGICIDFNDGSCIQCEFKDKDMAMNFLHRNCREYGEHWEDLEKLKI